MSTSRRGDSKPQAAPARRGLFRLTPIALVVAGAGLFGSAQAQQAFSSAWFASKGAAQGVAASTGLLPNGLPASTLGSPVAQQQASRAQLQRSLDNLNLAAQAIAAQQAAQAAARQAALGAASTVPDGLGEGGLKVDTNSLTAGWSNANAPQQTVADGQTTVAIQQTADKAILNWETFNVGKNTTVQFQQQKDWAVLNRINDPLARPSQIQGQIKADGTVMLVNRNGIVFSGSSQTDTRNMVAAAAKIGDEQFRQNGIYSTQAGGAYVPSFTDAAGAVTVEAGARLNTAAPESATQGGGYVLLLGQQAANAGTITTPRGQVQMAAGDFFVVRAGQGTAANQTSTTRGNEVAPGFNAQSQAGRVANTGLLQAPEGDITLAGRTVVQDGVALSTTTVDTRGTIHLLASASDAASSVLTTARGLNAILLDDQNGRTALDSQRSALIDESARMDLARRSLVPGVFDNLSRQDDRRDLSRVEIVSGGDVLFEGGSTTLATGGQVAVSAGRSTIAQGARLDVSGAVGVQVAMAANDIEVDIQGNEQRDSPVNRDSGALNNTTVWIDRRRLVHVAAGVGGDADERWYTAGGLLEVGGYLGLQGHTIGEWAAGGGSVAFTGGALVSQAGSSINLSGGTLDVATGTLRQSWLKGADGKLYEVSNAPGDIAYTGLYRGFEDTHTRWGDSATAYFYNPLIGPEKRLENGYTVGRDAGQLIVATRSAVLEGDIVSTVYQGARQTDKADATLDGYTQSQDAAPLAAQLILGSYTTAFNTDATLGAVGVFHNLAPVAGSILFGQVQDIAAQIATGAALPQERIATLMLDSARLDGFGLGAIVAAAQDGVRVDGALSVVPGGSIALHAPQVTVDAGLTARGGSIALGNVLSTLSEAGVRTDQLMTAGAGQPTGVAIGNGAMLDTRGLWTNLQLAPDDGHLLPYIDGGAVDIRSAGGVSLAAGSSIDSSSGAALRADGSLQGGRGGDVTVVAGYAANASDSLIDAPLQVDGTIRGYGVSGGGTLTLGSGTAVGIGAGLPGANGTLQAGQTTQVQLQLGADYTVHAGDTIPADFLVTLRAIAAGQTLTAATTPLASSSAPVTVAAAWVVPTGSYVQTAAGVYWFAGSTVPAGSSLVRFGGPLPAGYTIPADAFPDGLSITPVTTRYAAGAVASADLLLPAGTVVLAGSTAAQDLAVKAPTVLGTGFFDTGFSHYAVQGRDGLAVAPGTELAVSMSVLLADLPRAQAAATGSEPGALFSVWTPPLYAEDAAHATLTQRGGASLSLRAGADLAVNQAPLVIGEGAFVSVDPGQAIDLRADGQLTVEGRLQAWGGSISLASLPGTTAGQQYDPGRSVWIGENAVLDVSGHAYVAQDSQGRAYGVAPDGGSITVGNSDAYLIVRPGALLDASGAAAQVDAAAGGPATEASRTVALASAGGSIELHSNNGIVLDGTLKAQAGGAQAAGGSLALYLDSRIYQSLTETLDDSLNRLHTITLVQQAGPSTLAADLAPGQRDANLLFGDAVLGANQVQAGGFSALTLSTHDAIRFQGDLDLSLGGSLNLKGGVLTVASGTPDAQVRLAAPYIRLDGGSWDAPALITEFQPGFFTPVAGGYGPSGHSSLTLQGQLIDLYGASLSGARGQQGTGTLTGGSSIPQVFDVLGGFADIVLRSSGDVRLAGGLTTAGNIEVDAQQLYPMSGQNGALVAGLYVPGVSGNPIAQVAADSQLVIRASDGQVARGDAPAVPYSAFGNLILMGGTVDQGGVVRAPLGTISLNTIGGAGATLGTGWQAIIPFEANLLDPKVVLRGGSLTSVSAAGLEMPFGGTVDGVSYSGATSSGAYRTQYDLADTYVSRGDNGGNNRLDQGVLSTGVSIGAAQLIGEAGAVIDLSGGGVLHGEGFVSGRGGSVNVLNTPLANANPVIYGASQAGSQVYALLPGYQSAYAPVILDKGAGDPAVGTQIRIGDGVPGLPAGTYTLLPSSFALMPGAFRVELGGTTSLRAQAGAVALADGSWSTTAVQGQASTGSFASLPAQLLVTPGDAVRHIGQYNETSFSQFLLAQAVQFDKLRGRLPEDGKILDIDLRQDDDTANPLQFAGTVLFSGVTTTDVAGMDGWMSLSANAPIEVRPATAAATAGTVSLVDRDLNAFAAGTLSLGGSWRYFDGTTSAGDSPRIYFGSDNLPHPGVTLREGASLRAGQVFLVGDQVRLEQGAGIDTRGFDGRAIDSSLGYVFANGTGASGGIAVLATGNGWLEFLPSTGTGSIAVADGASLLTQGSVVFAAPGGLDLGRVDIGARYLTVSQDQINLGTDASLAAAQSAGALQPGWNLTQDVLDKLLRPSATAGVPALERLSLTAGGAFNFYGSSTLDTGGSTVQMVFNTPAFYGWGGANDVVRIATGDLVWNGISTGSGTSYASKPPAALLPGGPGSGAGRLEIDARTVEFGYDALSQPQSQVALDRVVQGFSGVAIHASDRVTANHLGSLTVGGDLDIDTPLLTGHGGSDMRYQASGHIAVTAPQGAAPVDTAAITELGAALKLQAQTVTLDTAVALPSGQLSVESTGDITLGSRAVLDLAGRTASFFDVDKYSWGGAVALLSDSGSITQAAGSRIDVSAAHSAAGSLSADARQGAVTLAGTLDGHGAAGFADGRFTLAADRLDSAAFADLNTHLDDAGFFEARSVSLSHGDLAVDGRVKAHDVSLAVNGGSLTVNGSIDASGDAPGRIALAASGDLLLASAAVLDTHGNTLVTDSYGAPIDASNRGRITLTSTNGTVRLNPGATLDLRSPDGIARGQVEINAPRTAETSGDVRIEAGGALDIRGAASIALNAFQTYQPPGADAIVRQDNGDSAGAPVGADGVIGLDQIDTRSRQFIDAAWANSGLSGAGGRLAGLQAYGAAFHLRPGVEIRSAGDLTVDGDLDLSGYRYGPGADPAQRGSGEPGVLALRAGGSLLVHGSINDGFLPPPQSPDSVVYGVVFSNETLAASYTAQAGDILGAGSTLPITGTLTLDLPAAGIKLYPRTGTPLSFDVVTGATIIVSKSAVTNPNQVLAADVITSTGVLYAAGTPLSALPTILPAGTTLKAGTLQLGSATTGISTRNAFIPRGTAMALLGTAASTTVAIPSNITLAAGDQLPAGTFASSITGQTGAHDIWPLSAMLAPGSLSWSLRLVAGADLASADSRGLRTDGSGADLVLDDPYQVNIKSYGAQGAPSPGVSVLRTGTGDLELYTAGDYIQKSAFGVYTAGTALAGTGAGTVWNASRELYPDLTGANPAGTLLGSLVPDAAGYAAAINDQRMWYPTAGGDFTLSARGNISGWQNSDSEVVGTWLWRQGGAELGQATAWGVNFGTYLVDGISQFAGYSNLNLAAFSGMGTLGGGKVVVKAGGNIGADGSDSLHNIVVAAASSGRVVDGQVLQTGGGDISVTAGGQLYGGLYAGLRGDTTLQAGSVGVIQQQGWGVADADPRGLDNHTAYSARMRQGASFAPGDGQLRVQALGDLVMGDVVDPGRAGERLETQATLADGSTGRAAAWFTLWQDNTGIELFSAGGNLSPLADAGGTGFLPATLRAIAPGGSIYYAPRLYSDYLMPSPTGQLELLAGGLISGLNNNSASNSSSAFGLLGTSATAIATPLRPGWRVAAAGSSGDSFATPLASNFWAGVQSLESIYEVNYEPYSGSYSGTGGTPFVFGPNTLSDDSMAGSGTVSHIYANTGDLLGVRIGELRHPPSADGSVTDDYLASKPVQMVAGGDIVNSGGLFAHGNATDVSMLAAGGSIYYRGNGGVTVMGPGTLEISAGGDIFLGNAAAFVSAGPVTAADSRPGAGIAVQAGLGAGLPGQGASDFAGFAARYLDPANLMDASRPLAEQPGKVAKTYETELAQWLAGRWGFSGSAAEALAYFDALAPEQQRIFVRQVFYAELTAGGREFNDVTSSRAGSYLRGRQAIAALFPETDAAGQTVQRQGAITLYQGTANNAGIRTVAGGDIQTLTPGGATIVGVEGVTPAASADATPAGLLTQGDGSIQMYSQDSILLGLSRIMTTFGGDILAWSATGDINAGRGSKTTLVYTPPKREYDSYGNVKLSPNVPSTGAGIATLNPIPEVPPGDVDLIAPLGTIDAGEAGIRVSGNVNLAALQVVNAANIQVQGKSTGIPTVAAVNVGALTNASAAASQAVVAAQDAVQRERAAARQNQPSVFTVRVLGANGAPVDDKPASATPGPSAAAGYDAANFVQLVGHGQDFKPEMLARLSQAERRLLEADR
ncbi:filamentous hemagglutinin N-terminal domain-containing protein [Xylophilus rhododendri]|uniref:Filamentous hemagglutinin N-terminal domain-containing protein n=1 Tax=Xylophilus rhododendri TaxID=2697032 RepID=A0A857J2E1_9BURK|nr:filamentous haemagglutinin family protein [Xylophilus rhododendri]QHI97393.1 filamentous hemagglutinin N-terminal domain-containing protein [Xylophilus rhododendri]